MNLTRIAIRRPIATLMLMLAVVLLGIVAYSKLPVRRLPSVNFPHITVVLSDPGASPGTMRAQMLDPAENSLTQVSGIVNMSATARAGNARISLRFPGGTNINQVAVQVANVVNQAAATLPVGALPPLILKADPNALPVMDVALYGASSPSALYDVASQTVAPALTAVPGVATVNMIGGRPQQVNVTLSSSKLEQYGLTMNQVKAAIATQNSAAPVGVIQQGSQANPVQVSGQAGSLTALRQIEIPSQSGLIPLSQLGTIAQGNPPVTTLSHLNGKNAIGFVISVQSNANTLTTAAQVRATIRQIADNLPAGEHLLITGDITSYTRQSMTATQRDLFFVILAAGLMILVWLHRLRMTLVILLTIPVTLCATFLAMDAAGFSIDMISLMALSLLIGILVDDAIVVLENIERHRKGGLSPAAAAYRGRMEIGGAALAITLTDVVVYAPVAFMQGNIGQLFREFGLTIVFATLFSLFVSFTLTPLLAAHFVWRGRALPRATAFSVWWEERFTAVRTHYERILHFALRHALLVFGVLFITAAGDIALLQTGAIATTYTPKQNTSVFFVSAQMPNGSSIGTTDQAVNELAARIKKLPGVSAVFSTTGFGNGSVTAENLGRLTVDLKTSPQPSVFAILPEIQAISVTIPGLKIQTSLPNALISGGGGSGGALSVVLRGPAMSGLQALSQRVTTALTQIPGVVNPVSTAQNAQPQLTVTVSPQAVSSFGLSGSQVGQAIRTALQGVTASQYRPSANSVSEPIVLQLGQGGQSMTVAQLGRVPVAVENGVPILLGQIATISSAAGPAVEREYNRALSVQITANTGGQPLGQIANETRNVLRKIAMPAGYSYQFNGAIQQKARAFGPLSAALRLSLVLIYMVLAALYESFLDPLAVIATLPLALTGALFGLWVTGVPFSLYAFIATIMLMGLVSKNAILLIDAAKRILRDENQNIVDALVQAGSRRLRPILMTTATMTLAMAPLLLPIGSGASTRMPMAIVLVGGMLGGTLLTLFVLPVLYLWMFSAKRILRARMAKWKEKSRTGRHVQVS
ncbi:efflux RND transporter permease subunit [Ferroacidibacillus organovorans]|uniref:Acriflavine resistance protein B n=1 Tax=Ferroacidibacillus organovorans TaxID=1765683 RepID=A0A101XNN7_9BACL|nr:efflux RND transporter permease subunit [Ferroacidibacillus organovorans]KUO94720.1 hypothetical protein ATW55_02330 [Ferroacidibacillus organovorans]